MSSGSEPGAGETLVEAYAQALYSVDLPRGRVVLSLAGVECGDRAVLPDASLTVITAYNPWAERPGMVVNERANRRLETHIRHLGWRHFAAEGYNAERSHVEPSFAVEGLTRAASVSLGEQFRQACVFYWSGARGELLWCRRLPRQAM